MKILSSKLFIVAFAVATVFATTVYAKSIFDIEYPILELGGCADKTACKTYCDDPGNQEVCESFAASYGVGDAKKRVEERIQRRDLIQKDGGPGNCAAGAIDPEESCYTYCDNPENLNECVTYGKSNGFLSGHELEEAEKVVKALASGVALPEGCTSAESCKQMCEEPENVDIARACFSFAEKAGLLPADIDHTQAEKVFKLIEEGKTPFKSPKDFKQCEDPQSDEIMEKCLKFGEDNDLIPQKDLEMIKKTGGKGPGGCRGKEQCDTYCNGHQEECMKFAEEHDLISPEDRARMEEGLTRFKEEIKQVPAEVEQCLEDAVGADILAQMIAGTQNPTREFGDTMRTCFEGVFGSSQDQPGMHEGGFPGIMSPQGEGTEMPFDLDGSTSSFRGGVPSVQDGSQRRMFPPQVEECVKAKVGDDDAMSILGKGEVDKESAIGQAISVCMRDFEGPRGEGFFQGQGEERPYMAPKFDGGQGTSSRLFQQRSDERFDPRNLIDPQTYWKQQGMPYGASSSTAPAPYDMMSSESSIMYPPRDYDMIPPYQGEMMPYDGQLSPFDAPQVQPYYLELHGGVIIPTQEVVNVVIEPVPVVEPVN